MLKAIVLTLKSGFEIAFIVGFILVSLKQMNQSPLSRWVFWGLGAAALLGGFIAYNIQLVGGRELFEGLITVVEIGALVALLFWIWQYYKKEKKGELDSSLKLVIKKVYLLILSVSVSVIQFLEIARFPKNIFIQTYNVINTELIVKFAGGFLGLVISGLFGLAFYKIGQKINFFKLLLESSFAGIVIILKQIVILAQILFATGVIPLSPLALKILLPFINNMDKFLYTLLLIGIVFMFITFSAIRVKGQVDVVTQNKAQDRKFRAAIRMDYRWLGMSASLLLLIVSLFVVETVYANKTVELSPAVPVEAKSGEVVIPIESVNDRNLHRFGYKVADGIEVRFIVIRKSETTYGIGLDACDICGAAGYYQRKDQVICRNCDVVMNIPTIGFPGGCNPVPLAYVMENGNIVINTDDIEKEKERFMKTSVFNN